MATGIGIGHGFRAKATWFGSKNKLIDIRWYSSETAGAPLQPGILGVQLSHQSWETLKERYLEAADPSPCCQDVEIDLGEDRAIGKYDGKIYLCR